MTMKKSAILAAALLLCCCLLSGAAFADPSSVPAPADTAAVSPIGDSVLNSRVAHILSLNYASDCAAESDHDLIQDCSLALLGSAEEIDGFMYVRTSLIEGLIFNLYGRRVNAGEADLGFIPAVEGYTAVIPRGYDTFEHTLVSVEPTGTGLTVTSVMAVVPHDGDPYSVRCVTELDENPESSFGYSIVSSRTSAN